MLPAIVMSANADLDKRSPLWSLRFADKAQASLNWGPVRLLRVTQNARTNDVLPSSRPTTIFRNHMIQIEVTPIENLAAVLASVAVSFKNVVTRELHFLFWQSVEERQ